MWMKLPLLRSGDGLSAECGTFSTASPPAVKLPRYCTSSLTFLGIISPLLMRRINIVSYPLASSAVVKLPRYFPLFSSSIGVSTNTEFPTQRRMLTAANTERINTSISAHLDISKISEKTKQFQGKGSTHSWGQYGGGEGKGGGGRTD